MPKQVVIADPVINSPFDEPKRHFDFDEDGIPDTIIDRRRDSCYFVPIAQPHKKGARELVPGAKWTKDRIEKNQMVNAIRRKVNLWREGRYFLVRVNDAHGPDDPLSSITEVSGQKDDKVGEEKAAEVADARDLWVPAVNNAGMWGRWAFLEIANPWDAMNTIKSTLAAMGGMMGSRE